MNPKRMREILEEINGEMVTGRPPRWALFLIAISTALGIILALL